jgi:hypothetical protein
LKANRYGTKGKIPVYNKKQKKTARLKQELKHYSSSMSVALSILGLGAPAHTFSFVRIPVISSRSAGFNSGRHVCKKEIPEYKICSGFRRKERSMPF